MAWKQKICYILPAFLVLIIALLSAWCFLLPLYLNSESFLQTIRGKGLAGFDWDVGKIGATGAVIASVRIGPDRAQALKADLVRLEYTPAGLMRRHVRHLLISGLELHCAYREGEFSIRGFDLKQPAGRPSPPGTSPAASTGTDLPFSFDTMEIRSAVILFEWQGSIYRIPLNARFSETDNAQVLHGTVHLLPRQQEIALEADYDMADKTVHWKMKSDEFAPQRFADIIGNIQGLTLKGALNLVAGGDIRLNPFEIASAQAEAQFCNAGSAYKAYQLQTTRADAQTNPPLQIQVKSVNGREWGFSASGLAIQSPLFMGISTLEGQIRRVAGGGIDTSGHAALFVKTDETKGPGAFKVTAPLHLDVNFSGAYDDKDSWRFNLGNAPAEAEARQWSIEADERFFAAGRPELDISGRGGPDNGKIEYHAVLPHPRATIGIDLNSSLVSVNGDVLWGADSAASGTIAVAGTKGRVRLGKNTLEIPDFGLSGGWKSAGDQNREFDGAFTLGKGRLSNPESGLEVTGIDARLPLHWPWAPSPAGKFSAAGIQYANRRVGSLKGIVYQDLAGLAFTGTLAGDLLPGAVVRLTGFSHFLSESGKSEVRFDGGYHVKNDLDLAKVMPDLKGVSVNGDLTVSGTMASGPGGLHASASATLENCDVRIKSGDMTAKNIRLKIDMPELLTLRSAPAQELSIAQLSMGKIHMNELQMQFQIESGKSILVEKSGFKWCGGQVNAQALRIFPGVNDYDVTLYCDRLELADLLEQLGAAQAAGKGTVNGYVPVHYTRGKIIFDDGFLFTTPGDGGTIQVTGAQMLTSGIPKGSPQYDQIDLAREALKDYEYEWARIRMRTEAEMLILDLQFNGKPVNPLPFVYDEAAGGFIRMKGSGQVSHFQGIRINVNLQVPLNKILRYKSIWDTLQ